MATRNERVVLTLDDHFSTPMARAAAATALTNKELRSLSGTSVETSRSSDGLAKSTKGVGDEASKTGKKVREYTLEMALADQRAARLRRSLREQADELLDLETAVDRTGDAFRRGESDLNRYSGRLRLITEAITVFGPGLIPLGGAAIPALAGLTAGLTAAAGAAGIALIAFNGVGDALEAIDAFQLSPTTDNLHAMQEALDSLGPAGADFARFIDSLGPELESIQSVVRAGLFPGIEDGIKNLLPLLPQVERILFDIATALGQVVSEAGAGLAGGGFAAFFDYLENDAAPTLISFAHATGNVAEGLASLMVAMAPLSSDFAGGLERATRSFANWSAGLSETQGFQDFIGYLRETGPQVIDLLGAIGTAFVGIVRAAAPVGQALLPILTGLANVLGAIANSPIGPPLFTGVAAMVALNRAAALADGAVAKLGGTAATTSKSLAGISGALNLAAIIAGLQGVEAAMDKVFGQNNFDEDNDFQRKLEALADDRVVGNMDDLGKHLSLLNRSFAEVQSKTLGWVPFTDMGDSWGIAKKNIDVVDQALANMVESGNGEKAAAIFQRIQAQATDQGVSVAETTKWFGQYSLAVENAGEASAGAAAATNQYAVVVRDSGNAAGLTRSEIRGLADAMEEQRQAALDAFDAVTRYGEALADARKRAQESNAGINENTKAGRENREALSRLAAEWNNQSDAVRNNVSKAAAARQSFINLAKQMGVNEDRARNLAKRLLEIPNSVIVKLEAKDEQALDAIRRVKAEMATLKDKSFTITYYVNQINRANKPPVLPGSPDGLAAAGGIVESRTPEVSLLGVVTGAAT